MSVNAYQVVRDFEKALCDYTGAKYAVTTNSCTMALLIACAYYRYTEGAGRLSIPKRTYVSVPMSAINAGYKVAFRNEDWLGAYQLDPLPVWDSARRFTSGMFRGGFIHNEHGGDIIDCSGQMLCVSFHASKILGDTQGGAILHDNDQADAWLRRARFDGRTEGVAPKDDTFEQIGWHCYMSNDVAARLLLKLSVLPKHNADLPNDPYPDLSTMEVFK